MHRKIKQEYHIDRSKNSFDITRLRSCTHPSAIWCKLAFMWEPYWSAATIQV